MARPVLFVSHQNKCVDSKAKNGRLIYKLPLKKEVTSHRRYPCSARKVASKGFLLKAISDTRAIWKNVGTDDIGSVTSLACG